MIALHDCKSEFLFEKIYMGVSAHWKHLSLHIYEGPYNTELYLLDLEQHMLSSN